MVQRRISKEVSLPRWNYALSPGKWGLIVEQALIVSRQSGFVGECGA